MATVQSYFGTAEPPRPAGRKSAGALLVGIEVELENVPPKNALAEMVHPWKPVRDGSLKLRGMEFTLAVWHPHAHAYLEQLFKIQNRSQANDRCSIHVHANVNNFTLEQLQALILLYVVFERPMFHFSGNRWNNIYCVPLQTWMAGTSLKDQTFGTIAETFPKYSAINVIPDGQKGTVEFRHMAGNKNPHFISTWIELIARLVQYSQKQELEQVIARLSDMRHTSSYWDLANEIFGDLKQALNYSAFDKHVEHGITFAKLITD